MSKSRLGAGEYASLPENEQFMRRTRVGAIVIYILFGGFAAGLWYLVSRAAGGAGVAGLLFGVTGAVLGAGGLALAEVRTERRRERGETGSGRLGTWLIVIAGGSGWVVIKLLQDLPQTWRVFFWAFVAGVMTASFVFFARARRRIANDPRLFFRARERGLMMRPPAPPH
jgi:hypothetical protein